MTENNPKTEYFVCDKCGSIVPVFNDGSRVVCPSCGVVFSEKMLKQAREKQLQALRNRLIEPSVRPIEMTLAPVSEDEKPEFVIENGCLLSCSGNAARIEIPSDVTSISPKIFDKCKTIREVIIPEGITYIPRGAFQYCTNLEKVRLPETLKTIESNAFKECRNLKEISLPPSIMRIGTDAFFNSYYLDYGVLFERPAKCGKSIAIADSWLKDEYIKVLSSEAPDLRRHTWQNPFAKLFPSFSIKPPNSMILILIYFILINTLGLAALLKNQRPNHISHHFGNTDVQTANEPVSETSDAEEAEKSNTNVQTQSDAVAAAKQHLEYSYYSHSRMVETLMEKDGFSHDLAVYGADHCEADWNEQAALQAATRLNDRTSVYSPSNLIYELEYYGFTHDEAVYGMGHCNADWTRHVEEFARLRIEQSPQSYKNLVTTLTEYDGFTHEQAVHGADQCGADWNEQAERSVRWHLENDSYSYSEMIEILTEYDGYTKEQAVYGADHCEADWFEQAEKQARKTIEITPCSYASLVRFLSDMYGFTQEEAVYAADHCGADWFEQAELTAKEYYDHVSSETGTPPSYDEVKELLTSNEFTEEQAVHGAESVCR